MGFGKRLAQAREGKLSQQQLAERLHKDQSTIAKWETEERQPRNLNAVAEKIARELGVSASWLLTGTGDGPGAERPAPPATVSLDRSVLVECLEEYFQILERRRPNWDAHRKAIEFVEIYGRELGV